MALHIVEELNSNKESAAGQLVEIYSELSLMISYSKYCYNLYDSDLFEVFHFDELVRQEWGVNILSKDSFNLLNNFYIAWKEYRISNLYGDDEIFIYSDNKWHQLVSDYLIPLLINFEVDFDSNNIQYKSYIQFYDPDARPSDEDILERGRTLYKLLIDHGIIKRKYL